MSNAINTAVTGVAIITTADTSVNGENATTLVTGGSNGTFIFSVYIKAVSNTSEGMIRFFVEDSSGSTSVLIREQRVIAVEASNTSPRYAKTVTFPGLYLQAGYKFKVATVTSEAFNIVANASTVSYP